VLVTGGAGFIGSHTVDLLLERGYDVTVLDSLQEVVHPNGKPGYVPTKVRFLQGDVSDRSVLLDALKDCTGVFHLAAYQDYLPDFSRFIHVNAESSALLFELIVAQKLPVTKIVFASSQSVAGEGKYRCPEHGSCTPPPRPLSQLEQADWEVHCPLCGTYMTPELIPEETATPGTAYAISKRTIEHLALRLGPRYGIPSVCMRYTYVQGPRNSFHNAYSGILRRFALRILHGLAPVCYEDGQQLRDYINVRDVALANVIAFEHPDADFQILNAGGGRAVTVEEFAKIAISAFDRDLQPSIPGEFRVGDTRHTVSDITRMRALGWEPTVPVEDNIAQYRDWLESVRDTVQYNDEAERVMREANVVRRASVK
jgi:dTDP-L-rhamnose 4-epimerase